MTTQIQTLIEETKHELLEKLKSFQSNIEYGCYYSAKKETLELGKLCDELSRYLAIETKLKNLEKQLEIAQKQLLDLSPALSASKTA